MYEAHIAFSDGSPPFYKNYMSRQEYNDAMREFQKLYRLTLDRSADSSDVRGSRLIFLKADRLTTREKGKSLEVAKSRARYYSRTDGRTREGRRKRSGTEG